MKPSKVVTIYGCGMCPFAGKEIESQGRYSYYCIKMPIAPMTDHFSGAYEPIAIKQDKAPDFIPTWCPLEDK